MPRLFIDSRSVVGDRVRLDGAAARHLGGSLRVTTGDTVTLVDDSAVELDVVVTDAAAGVVTGRITARRPAGGDPAVHVEIVQALPKDGMDDAIDGLVQAGAAVIRPVLSERTVARPDAARAAHRLQRWQAIAREAAQLAYRARIPIVQPLVPLIDALADLPVGTRVIACVISNDAQALTDVVLDTGPVAICIGPEGGFGPADIAALRAHGAEMVHLGSRVLRARLAGTVATALLLGANGALGTPRSRIDAGAGAS